MIPLKQYYTATLVLVAASLATIPTNPCLVVATKASPRRVLPEFTKWHVSVVNGLRAEIMAIHCRSKDNDLGARDLSPGTNFTWSFRENFFQRTLFWCNVEKDDGHARFDVFWQDVLLFYKCLWKECIWVAKHDGIYLKDLDTKNDEFRYKWEPGLQP
ncbi:S-protein homolog 74-like [Tripterygium wilfordii]|uniref:S-protein homolog 74-like n=1 Tax=Tripterygium wilfordii TaxID=458696 RepID=UPI0018F856C8|nr:S-protein homolog 74-like [Tripterygium wilfordii]